MKIYYIAVIMLMIAIVSLLLLITHELRTVKDQQQEQSIILESWGLDE